MLTPLLACSAVEQAAQRVPRTLHEHLSGLAVAQQARPPTSKTSGYESTRCATKETESSLPHFRCCWL